MSSPGPLMRQQLIIGAQIVASVAVQIAFIQIGLRVGQGHSLAGGTMGDRLAFALGWEVFAALVLMVMVGWIAALRVGSPDAIDGNDQAARVAVQIRIQRNTLEQLVLALVGHLTLSTLLPPAMLRLIPVLVGLFVLGRLTYWLGYSIAPPFRAFGFAMTFYPTVGCLLASAWLLMA